MPGRRRRQQEQVIIPAALPALAANQLRYDAEDRLDRMSVSRSRTRVVDKHQPLMKPYSRRWP